MAQPNQDDFVRKLTPPPDSGPLSRQKGPWGSRVAFATEGSFAFRPGQLICKGAAGLDAGQRAIEKVGGTFGEPVDLPGEYKLLVGEFDVEAAARHARDESETCEPNYVLFAHGETKPSTPLDCWCGCCSGGGGLAANPFFANSVQANPFFANPFFANPFFANPFFANPFFANPFFANSKDTGVQPSSAIPADEPTAPKAAGLTPGKAKVIILDTGIAEPDELPVLLDDARFDKPLPADIDPADEGGDDFLDPASGHGTFVAGIIEQLAPGHDVLVLSVLTSYGEGDVASIANRIDLILKDLLVDENTIVNMSFGSYADEKMHLLEDSVAALQQAGAVVVASAGNDGTCRPSYPACLPGVISVGSIEPTGPAFYSNHGPWVRACAPGTALVSAFFDSFIGKLIPGPGGIDPDNYDDWASWTGTSFAAPVVTAALVRQIAMTDSNAKAAAAYVIDSPGLFRYPGLGTVVNLTPGM